MARFLRFTTHKNSAICSAEMPKNDADASAEGEVDVAAWNQLLRLVLVMESRELQ